MIRKLQIFLIAFAVIFTGDVFGSNPIELNSLVRLVLENPTIESLSKAIKPAEVPAAYCCHEAMRNDMNFQACIRGTINGQSAHMTNKKEIPWLVGINREGNSSIWHCGSSFEEVFGEDIEQYLLKNGFQLERVRCGVDNGAAEGVFIYKGSTGKSSMFFLEYGYVAASGGYDFSLGVYPKKLPSEINKDTKPCSAE